MRLKSLFLAGFFGVGLVVGAAQAESGDPVRGEQHAATCLGCHAVEGSRNAYPSYRVPMIGGQTEAYLYNSLKAYQDGTRNHGTMAGLSRTLSEQEMRDIAAFFARQK